jgi:light-regulated signal transduction histidine kinase (bacteriophytochrome)
MITQQLTNCDKEPIHILSKIQQHGMLCVVSYDNYLIQQISANYSDFLNSNSEEIFNREIKDFFGEELILKLNTLEKDFSNTSNIHSFKYEYMNKRLFFVVHLEKEYLIIEIEKLNDEDNLYLKTENIIENALRVCETNLDYEQLLYAIVNSVKKVSGFDRVLMYKFDEDYNGTVLAEASENFNESFLHHHFPSSDIPSQARELYIKNKFRIIEDVEKEDVYVTPLINPLTSSYLNMSMCYLRSVSPIHMEYLRNMGVKSSMSLSIVINNKLWGLIACHHTQAKKIPLELFKTYYLLSNIFSERIQQKEFFIDYTKSAQLLLSSEVFITKLNSLKDYTFFDALISIKSELKNIIKSDECVIFKLDKILDYDGTLKEEELQILYEVCFNNLDNNIFYSHKIGDFIPQTLSFSSAIGGIILVQIETEIPFCIMFIRYEQICHVKWAGNPNKKIEFRNGNKIINPRASFETWKQTVSGSCEKFEINEIEKLLLFSKRLINSYSISKAYYDSKCANEEKRLLKEQKIESIVDVVNNIAHHWRQPLSVISSISSNLEVLYKCGEQIDLEIVAKQMELISQKSQYLSRTIDDFEWYTKKVECPEIFSVSKAIFQTVNLFKSILNDENIEIILNINEDKQMLGFENEFIQALINIFENAKDAFKDKTNRNIILINTKLKEEKLEIEILDNAGGIKNELIPRIFEPYFTTKHQVVGTGLGLYISHEIFTKHHNATIEISNKEFKYDNELYFGASILIKI